MNKHRLGMLMGKLYDKMNDRHNISSGRLQEMCFVWNIPQDELVELCEYVIAASTREI